MKRELEIIHGPAAANNWRSVIGKLRKFVWFKYDGKLATNKPVEFKYSNGFQSGFNA